MPLSATDDTDIRLNAGVMCLCYEGPQDNGY